MAESANPRERQDNSSGENQKPDKRRQERPQDYGERLTRSPSFSISIRNDRARKGRQYKLGDISNTPYVKAKPLEMESAVLVRIFRVCYQVDIIVPNAFGLYDTLNV